MRHNDGGRMRRTDGGLEHRFRKHEARRGKTRRQHLLFNAVALGPGLVLAEVAGSAFCPLTLSRRLLSFASSTLQPAIADWRATRMQACWCVVVPVDRSQPEGVSSKTTAAATPADDQSWSAAPWHQPTMPTRCFSGLSTVTGTATDQHAYIQRCGNGSVQRCGSPVSGV